MNSKDKLILALPLFTLSACFVLTVGTAPAAKQKAASKLSYNSIRPIITVKCESCHNDKRHPEAVNLSSFAKLLKSGEHGIMVAPGHPEKSKLYLYVDGEKNPRMPFKQAPLSKKEIAAIRDWIKLGARA